MACIVHGCSTFVSGVGHYVSDYTPQPAKDLVRNIGESRPISFLTDNARTIGTCLAGIVVLGAIVYAAKQIFSAMGYEVRKKDDGVVAENPLQTRVTQLTTENTALTAETTRLGKEILLLETNLKDAKAQLDEEIIKHQKTWEELEIKKQENPEDIKQLQEDLKASKAKVKGLERRIAKSVQDLRSSPPQNSNAPESPKITVLDEPKKKDEADTL